MRARIFQIKRKAIVVPLKKFEIPESSRLNVKWPQRVAVIVWVFYGAEVA